MVREGPDSAKMPESFGLIRKNGRKFVFGRISENNACKVKAHAL